MLQTRHKFSGSDLLFPPRVLDVRVHWKVSVQLVAVVFHRFAIVVLCFTERHELILSFWNCFTSRLMMLFSFAKVRVIQSSPHFLITFFVIWRLRVQKYFPYSFPISNIVNATLTGKCRTTGVSSVLLTVPVAMQSGSLARWNRPILGHWHEG